VANHKEESEEEIAKAEVEKKSIKNKIKQQGEIIENMKE